MLNTQRIEGLRRYMAREGLTQVLMGSPININYFADFGAFTSDRATFLYVSQDRAAVLCSDVIGYTTLGGMDVVYHTDGDNVCAEVAKVTDHAAPLGFDGGYPAKWLLPLRQFGAGSDYVLADRAINLQRAHKDEEERRLLRQASEMNDRVMKRVRGIFHDGITEREAAAIISRMFVEEGADMPGWCIVAFAEGSADVHHHNGDARLKRGDTILVDMGSPRKGYHSDMTRTFFWKEVSDYQREIYELVKNANLAGEAAVRPGARCCDVDAAARDMIAAAGYGPNFTHRLGHYIGLELHDPGDIIGGNTDPVEEGMAFSCEPGVYLPGKFGVRVEDLVIVKADGTAEVLNHDNKELEVLSD